MKQITSADVIKRLNDRAAIGHHVDPRLIQAVQAPGELSLFTLEDE